MQKQIVLALAVALALPVLAHAQEPPAPQPPAQPGTPAPAPPQPETPPPTAPQPEAPKAKSPIASRFFYGGGVGLAFGTVDYVEVAPLVGFKVVPRFDVGAQPFYRWTNDGRYLQDQEFTDYGARFFARFRVWASLFVEGDYEYTSYEFLDVNNTTSRDTYDTFLLGGGYAIPMGNHVAFYFSALYDFSYDSDVQFGAYDSPVRIQAGVTVWF